MLILAANSWIFGILKNIDFSSSKPNIIRFSLNLLNLFFDEMKTPEIKKNMQFGHHK